MHIFGHRGASGYLPENTLASFARALELDVNAIEMDVYTLKTGEVVVIHDDTVDRTTNGTGAVEQFSFAQIRLLDAGLGQKVPLLTEVFDLVDRKILINIELKGRGTALPVAQIIDHYVNKKGWSDDQFLVSSFNHTELKHFITACPTVRTGALFEVRPTHYSLISKEHPAFSANLDSEFITAKNVSDAHASGLKVFAYTVNTRQEAERMEALGVDGIFTDYPDRVRPKSEQKIRHAVQA